ncbi:hypothetical protein ACLKA7_010770 [Drosophila subpalustris]
MARSCAALAVAVAGAEVEVGIELEPHPLSTGGHTSRCWLPTTRKGVASDVAAAVALLLLLPGILPSIPISLEHEASRIQYLKHFLGDVIMERPTDTLLILKRRQDNTCLMKEFNTHHLIPTLRFDESTIIRVKDLFNSDAIALVCMSKLADSKLLRSLAKDLHRMRETRIIIWLQLLLFLPGILPSIPISLDREASRIKYLEYFLGDVILEKPTDTLLILKRRHDNTCLLKEFNTHHLTPTLRFDESTIIRVKDLFNSEAIALVCMSELADSMLLTSLAKDLHRMRETRIIIWLQFLVGKYSALVRSTEV